MSTPRAQSGATWWRTVTAVARHEVRSAWRDGVMIALGAAAALLLVTACVSGLARDGAQRAQRERYQRLVGEQFDGQPARHPHRVSHYGYLVFRPPAPLAAFDPGLEAFTGTTLFLEAHRQNTANFSAVSQGGTVERLGDVSPATVLQLYLPLFVFALAGTSITRERERGTLALLLCQGTPWPTLLAGKLLGVLTCVAGIALPGMAVGALWVGRGIDWSPDVAWRAALLLPVHAVFVVACAALGLAVSARQRTSRDAIVMLSGVWFLLWIVVPRIAPVLAEAAAPLPARAVFESEVDARVRELGDAHNPDDPAFARLRADTLARYGVTRVEDLPFNYGGLVTREGEARTTEAYRQQQAGLERAYERQAWYLRAAAFVSPYLAVRLASSALAGSDQAHALEFERQAEEFRFRLIQSLNTLHMNEVSAARDRYGSVVGGAPTRQRIDAGFYQALPTFAFEWPGRSWALRQASTAVVALLLGVAAGIGALAAAARRGQP